MAYLGPLAAFMASVTWAFASTRYAELAPLVGTLRIGLVRAISASLLWLAVLAFQGGFGSLVQITPTQLLCLCGSILCSYALGDRVFFAAVTRIGVSSALAIATIYPLWAALYGVLMRGEPLGPTRAFGVLCCLLGVSAVLRMSHTSSVGRLAQGAPLWGAALALLTSWFWAGNTVFLKLGSEGLGLAQANAVRFPCGVILLLVQQAWLWTRAAPTPRGLAAASVSVPPTGERGPVYATSLFTLARKFALPLFLDTGLGSVCFVYGIANTDLALGATLSSLSPLVALAIGVASGSERLSFGKLAAVCTTLLGVVLLVATADR